MEPDEADSEGDVEEHDDKEEELLAPKVGPNPLDPEDKGFTPLDVPRRCTDCVWLLPFLAVMAASAWITHRSTEVGRPGMLFHLPDFTGRYCGGTLRQDKPYLYFCMAVQSEHIYDELHKSLNKRFPICVHECPTSFNTSSRCYLGHGSHHQENWEWVQDYPAQPLANVICRPHAEFAVSLFHQFEEAVTTAPPNLSVLLFLRNWNFLALAAGTSCIFSIVYIFSLSHCARCLIWSSYAAIGIGSALLCAVYAYHFDTGHLKAIIGRRAKDPVDLAFAVGFATVALVSLCQLRTLGQKLDVAGRVLEMACRCIVSTPSLTLMPMILAVQRMVLLMWFLFAFGNFLTTEMDDGMSRAQEMVYGSDKEWEYVEMFPTTNKAQVLLLAISLLWFNETMTAAACFVMFFTGQIYQLNLPSHKGRILCRVVRGYCIILRYHMGTVILAGLLQLFLGPLHMVLGRLNDAGFVGPIGFLIQSCCCCLLDFYKDYLEYLRRDALQDVSLQGMPFMEAARHISGTEGVLDEVHVLNTQTLIFQTAGLGLASLLGWLAVAQRLRDPVFSSHESEEYVPHPMAFCIWGAVVAAWFALPFMKIFDVVSDAVLYSKFVQKQRNPKPKLVEDSFRTCTWRQTMKDIASCQCGSSRRQAVGNDVRQPLHFLPSLPG